MILPKWFPIWRSVRGGSCRVTLRATSGATGPTLPKDRKSNYYRPLFLVWLRLNYSLFGREPLGWHVTSILVHALCAALFYLLAVRMVGNTMGAGIGALFFALHPVHVESVAWTSGVTETDVFPILPGGISQSPASS